MEQEIINRYHDEILNEARRRYGIAPHKMEPRDGFESFIYEYEREGGAYILRIGHSRRRSPELIYGEVDWINYLAAGGAGVARAVLSENGLLVEELADGQGGAFLATAFVKAPGAPPDWVAGWTEEFMLAYGRLLGRIHQLSKHYQLANPAWRRPRWDSAEMTDIVTSLSKIDPVAAARMAAVLAELRTLPQDKDGFGLIHQDAHTGNMFVTDDGRLTLFDFDDCAYGHYVYDIAMVLFYALTNREDAVRFGRHFWPLFWQGYCQENRLDPVWLAVLPTFMKLREIDLYAVILRDVSVEERDGDRWIANFMDGRQVRIADDIPYVNPDIVSP